MAFVRFCAHCGRSIEWDRLLKAITSRAKVFFCSDLCRFADANDKNREAKKMRSENPNRRECPECHGRGYTRVKRHQRRGTEVSGEMSNAAI